MTVWDKYKKINEIKSKGNITTYKAKLEPIIKEIIIQDKNEYNIILSNLKQQYKEEIIEIIQENNAIYVVLFNDIDLNNIMKEGYIKDKDLITKVETNILFIQIFDIIWKMQCVK